MPYQKKIAVIGLGYVGLPLAIEFAKHFAVVGFDINEGRIQQLINGVDDTHEADAITLKNVSINKEVFCKNNKGLFVTSDANNISSANIFIITVPTPIDRYNAPDLSFLFKASEEVGAVLKQGDIVIYESTVYPGCTEEECVPVLEKTSGLTFNKDFFCWLFS